jgi:beta-fructofuranosidase
MLTGNLPVLREFGLKRDLEAHRGDTAYLFVSDDLITWEYLHPFYTSSRAWTHEDEDNMCPDFFPLGDRHMLLFISHNHGCQYYIGRYEADHFIPETHGRMSWTDNAFFAPESLVDGRGRRIMWSWIFDGRDREAQEASGWSGTMSLPRVLWLGEDKTLRMGPSEEIAVLRFNPRAYTDLNVPAGSGLSLDGVAGDSLELELEIRGDQAAQFGVKICCSPTGDEQTLVFYDRVDRQLKIDTTRSSLGQGSKAVEGGPLTLGANEPLRLRIFVDRSVVEAFANDRQAVMRRIYPVHENSLGVRLFSREDDALVTSLRVWDLAPSNPW